MALVSSSSAATAVAALPSNGLAGARSSFLGAAGKAAAASRASFAVRAAAPERPIWFPGSTPPPWLDGRLVLGHAAPMHAGICCDRLLTLTVCVCVSLFLMQPSRRLRL
uniref:Chlorophyll a-b binding protein, chloroplastic n=1 Tax=Triticum urartu TaxID=4572 RepID=A0A8R7PD14_TRIUA